MFTYETMGREVIGQHGQLITLIFMSRTRTLALELTPGEI